MSNGADKSYPRIESRPLGLTEILLFCALLATLFSIFRGYFFGITNHTEQLPMLYRLLDASYCSRDFFVNANAEFGPRTYYIRLLALLGSKLPLSVVFLALTWLANFGVCLITYLAARDLIERSDFAAMIACVFVMGATGADIGDCGNIGLTYLVPGPLVYPLALLSLWAGIRRRVVICAVSASIAGVIHPLVGFEAGAIGLATAGLSVFFSTDIDKEHRKKILVKKAAAVFLGVCILAATAVIFWAGRIPKSLDTEQFVNLVAYFRHPHHYVPSTWSIFKYVLTALFLFSFAISWKWWRDELFEDKSAAYRILPPVFIILLLWCGGYIFVELLPCRLWTTAQVFRLAFMLNWLMFLVIARTVASALINNEGLRSAGGWLTLMGAGSIFPMFAFLGHIAEIFRRRIAPVFPKYVESTVMALLFLVAAVLLSNYGNMHDAVAVLAFMAVAVCFLLFRPYWYRNVLPLLVLCILVSGIIVDMRYRIPVLRRVFNRVNTNITSTYSTYYLDEIAFQAHRLTAKNALFLTPPATFGRFRLLAGRSVVVDFKSFPFQDAAMLEWRTRLQDCYGSVEKTGFAAAGEMDANYRSIPEQRLLMLARKYGVDYAVLYRITDCKFPVLFENRAYKIVKVTPGDQQE